MIVFRLLYCSNLPQMTPSGFTCTGTTWDEKVVLSVQVEHKMEVISIMEQQFYLHR